MHHVTRSTLVVASLVIASCSLAAEPITTGSLVAQMIDLKRLAEGPKPFFHTVQFSSYDHRSTLPGGPNWFGNSDGFGGDPVPNFEAVIKQPDQEKIGEYLICDVKGPGAIVRVWTAAISGTVRLYLDEADKPVFDGPAEQFFRYTYQGFKVPGLDDSLLASTFAQRNAGYYPIPFAKACRIVWIGNLEDIHFYHVQIREYEPGTAINTFRPEDLTTYADEIKRVAKVLADPANAWPYLSKREPAPIRLTLAPGQRQEAVKVDGPAAIERLTLKVSAADIDRALRQTVMQVICDDYPWGQVQSPVGDFFGAAPGINPYDSVPFTVQPDGTMICRYVMPFAKSARISFDNHGQQPVEISGSVLPVDYTWNDAASMHFRARWRVNHEVVGSNRAVQDMPYLIARGTGTYVGTALMLLNPSGGTHPSGSWWGEGDEKIFVDNDVRPSTFGTGAEDYFNYAWSEPDIFAFPCCGQPRDDGPANRGFVTNDRWHIIDCLPFEHSLSFYMELFCHGQVPHMSYARIAYHYGRPGLMDDHVAITDEDVRPLELPPNWQPIAFRGSANSVFFQAEDVLANKDQPAASFVQNNLWSGGRLWVWKPAKKGDVVAFKLPVKEAGKYVVHVTAAYTPDSGVVSAQLDDQPAGFGGKIGRVDLAVPYRTLLRTFSSKPQDLTAGDHTLTLKYESDPGRTIGIDFIAVQKQ
jgi:hypothetical protein